MERIQTLINLGMITEDEVIDYYNHLTWKKIEEEELEWAADEMMSSQQYDDYAEGEDTYVPSEEQDLRLEDIDYIQKTQEGPAYEEHPFQRFPEYIIASTATHHGINETMVFQANEDGEVLNWCEIAVLAERYGDKNWADKDAAVALLVHPEYKYVFVRDVYTLASGVAHKLYRRTTLEDVKSESELNGFESQSAE